MHPSVRRRRNRSAADYAMDIGSLRTRSSIMSTIIDTWSKADPQGAADYVAAIDSRLFVSKYQLELPSKEDLQRFLEEKRREMNDRG